MRFDHLLRKAFSRGFALRLGPVVLLIALAPFCVNGQAIYRSANILPPSPTAAELGKYGLVPVSMSSGTPGIDIPLHSFNTKHLSLPISVSYNSNGVKVDELSSWVGMGWSLNAGGVITRIVRDDPDEYSATSMAYPTTLNASDFYALSFLRYVGENDAADTESDIYSYNFAGYTGKFTFDHNGKILLMPYNTLVIQRVGNGFSVVTPDGVTYAFDEAETTTTDPNADAKGYNTVETSWYLTRIDHPLGDVIKLHYAYRDYYTYSAGLTQTITRRIGMQTCGGGEPGEGQTNACGGNYSESLSTNPLSVNGVHLSRIESEGYGAIEFKASMNRPDVTDRRLDTLVVLSPDGDVRKKFTMKYTNYSSRMFLTSLVEEDAGPQPVRKHVFEYDDPGSLPARLSYSQDHWGYFNGATNTYFVPKDKHTMANTIAYSGLAFPPPIGGNREPDPAHSKKGILKKITYPTGGSTSFTYEPNSTWGTKTIYPTATTFQLSCNGTEESPPVVRHQTITSPMAQVVEFSFSVGLMSGYTDPGVPGQLSIQDITVGGPVYELSLNAGQYHTNYYAFAASHQYRFTLTSNAPAISAYVTFTYSATAAQLVEDNIELGGLRVAKVVNHDPFSGTNEETNYFYARHDQLSHSSGVTVTTVPRYTYFHFTKNMCLTPGMQPQGFLYTCFFASLTSNNQANLFQANGGIVHYAYVTVSKGPNMENGVEEHAFIINFDQPATPVWGNNTMANAPTSNTGWDHGRERYVHTYRKSGANLVLTKKVDNVYVKDTRIAGESSSLVTRKLFTPPSGQAEVIKICGANDIGSFRTIWTCHADHNHAFACFTWDDEVTYCTAGLLPPPVPHPFLVPYSWWWPHPGKVHPEMAYDTVWYSPCYGKEVGDTVTMPDQLDFIDAIEYKNFSHWVYLKKTTDTTYDANGLHPLATQVEYFYDNPVHAQLTRTITTRSDGKEVETITRYPDDYNESAEEFTQLLVTSHIVNIPIKREVKIDSKQTAGEVVVYNQSGQPEKVYAYESASLQPPEEHDPAVVIPSAAYHLKTTLTNETETANLLHVQPTDNTNTAYLWGYNNRLPIAEVKNAPMLGNMNYTGRVDVEAVVYKPTSADSKPLSDWFELNTSQSISPSLSVTLLSSSGPSSPNLVVILSRKEGNAYWKVCTWGSNTVGSISLEPGEYRWVYYFSDQVSIRINLSHDFVSQKPVYGIFHNSYEEEGTLSSTARTGKRVKHGKDTVGLPGINGQYKLSYWQKSTSSPWTLVEQVVTVTAPGQQQPIGLTDGDIDEVRLHPLGAVMTTYTHDPQIGITSATDPNNNTTHYVYDAFGRLDVVKDAKGNPLKKYTYHYKE